jgi:hypothetical protein
VRNLLGFREGDTISGAFREMRPTPALLKFFIALLGLALAASVWDQFALLWQIAGGALGGHLDAFAWSAPPAGDGGL